MKRLRACAGVLLTSLLACSAFGSKGVSNALNSQSTSAQSTTNAAGELRFTPPADWVKEQPTSAMRVGQYKLPKAEGDNEDASLVIYFFGSTQGGTTQANIDRWISQIQPDGSSSKDKAKTETTTINGLKVTTVDVTGTYIAEVAPGSGTFHNDANYRLRAAVIETPKGNYFLKLAGPAKTMGRWEQSVTAFVKSFEFR